MNKARKYAAVGLAVGTLSGLALTGCAGGASPIGPSAAQSPVAKALAVPAANVTANQLAVGDISALGAHGRENIFVVCYQGDGSFTQLSVTVMGMAGAVQHCLKVLNGRVGGVTNAPPPLP